MSLKSTKSKVVGLLAKMGYDKMPAGEKIETLRSIKKVIDDLLYESAEGTALFEKSGVGRNEEGSPIISKGGFSFTSSENGVSIEVLDYHVPRSFISFDDIDKLRSEVKDIEQPEKSNKVVSVEAEICEGWLMISSKQAIYWDKWKRKLTPETLREFRKVTAEGVEYWRTSDFFLWDRANEDLMYDLMHEAIDRDLEMGSGPRAKEIEWMRVFIKAARNAGVEPGDLWVQFQNLSRDIAVATFTLGDDDGSGDRAVHFFSGTPRPGVNES